jgi:glycosyltransferase involved in cell wall biosynthesis
MDFVYHHRTVGRGGEGVHIMGMVRALEAAGHTVCVVGPPGVNPRETAGAAPVDKGARQVRGFQRVWKWISSHAPQALFELLELGYNMYARRVVSGALAARRDAVLYERYAFYLLGGVMSAKRRGRPVLLEVNEVVGIQRARRQLLTPVMRRLERATFRRADALFCVSSFLAEEAARRGADASRVHVMPNAVDASVCDLPDGGWRVRQELGIPETAVVAGFVGWFDRWDRLDLLVDTAAGLRSAHPQLRLLLVGDGPVAADLRERVRAGALENTVIFAGPVPRNRVVEFIDAMDIGLLPDSNVFGSPLVLFELMARGKAIIAPDRPPVRDVIEDDINGVVVPAGDRAALAVALGALLSDPVRRRRISEAAKARVRERHTWSRNAAFVAETATRLLQQQSP